MAGLKRAVAICVLFAIIVASLAITFTKWRKMESAKNDRLNVLIVSICSFQGGMLKAYGFNGESVAPAVDAFIETSSFYFTKMFNGIGWTSLQGYTWDKIPAQYLLGQGYQLFGVFPSVSEWLRIPPRRSDVLMDWETVNNSDFEKDHSAMTEYLKSRILSRREPFFVNVHYKYLHYPLIDRFNADAEWDSRLSRDERARLTEYLDHPGLYPDKLPFLLMLTNDPKYAETHPMLKGRFDPKDPGDRRRVTGVLVNRELLDAWRATPDFADDLKILNKIYAANVHYLDRVIGPLLNLYGDRDLQNRTVVVFSPDHGEVHMERGALTHGTGLFDEDLQVPFAIRFPRSWGASKAIRRQASFLTMSQLLREITDGHVTVSNFRERFEALADDVVVARDCANTRRGIRFRNKYKYFVEIASGERYLFDLESDPRETVNVAARHPDVVDRMEELYWKHYPEMSTVEFDQCAPWVQSAGL